MEILYNPQIKESKDVELGRGEIASLLYHDIFDYPLTSFELIKWTAGEKVRVDNRELSVVNRKNGFFYVGGREGMVLKRMMRERISVRKLRIAKRAAKILSLIPTVKMVAVTGALAMKNADEEADIDFMIVTKKGALWTTRLFILLLLDILRVPRRKYGQRSQKDKLCLNIWLDESNLSWRKRNAFTAHEIAHILPLVNKEEAYEKFILKNTWIRDYWPSSVRTSDKRQMTSNKKNTLSKPAAFYLLLITIFEPLAFWFQYQYMKGKMTHETVTPTRALFHPVDLGRVVLAKLQRRIY